MAFQVSLDINDIQTISEEVFGPPENRFKTPSEEVFGCLGVGG